MNPSMPQPIECARCGQVHDRCTGHRSDGAPCHKYRIKGGNVCATHGGSAPQVKAKAQERLLAMVDPALSVLSRLLRREDVPDNVKLAAVKDVLDRVGLSARQLVEVDVTHHDGDGELDAEIARLMEKLNQRERESK